MAARRGGIGGRGGAGAPRPRGGGGFIERSHRDAQLAQMYARPRVLPSDRRASDVDSTATSAGKIFHWRYVVFDDGGVAGWRAMRAGDDGGGGRGAGSQKGAGSLR
jgi:hypothetical protein